MPVTDDTLDFDEVLQVSAERGNFLTSDHTMAHFHDLWLSDYFRSDDPFSGPWDGTEKAVLDRCDAAWRANLDTWQPPEWPDDTLNAMDDLLGRARKEFGEGIE